MKCVPLVALLLPLAGRSREGAWIEMDMFDFYWPSFAQVAPARERGLKFMVKRVAIVPLMVAPARERGLKYLDNLNA